MWGMFFYDPQEIAYLICSQNLSAKKTASFLDKLWLNENEHLYVEYQTKKKKFILDVYRSLDYYMDKKHLDKEFPIVERDLNTSNHSLKDLYSLDYRDIDLFFKCIRLKILYLNNNQYSKIKLKRLLNAYGYKRRTKELVNYFYNALNEYHLKVSLGQGKQCDLSKVPLETTIVIKLDERID